jgi:hypothetical protein
MICTEQCLPAKMGQSGGACQLLAPLEDIKVVLGLPRWMLADVMCFEADWLFIVHPFY